MDEDTVSMEVVEPETSTTTTTTTDTQGSVVNIPLPDSASTTVLPLEVNTGIAPMQQETVSEVIDPSSEQHPPTEILYQETVQQDEVDDRQVESHLVETPSTSTTSELPNVTTELQASESFLAMQKTGDGVQPPPAVKEEPRLEDK